MLQILTLSCVTLLAIALILEARHNHTDSANAGLLSLLLLGLILIWKFNRLEHKNNKADLFLLLYLLPAIFFLEYWGAELPDAILLYVLIIIVTNLLSGHRATFLIAVPVVSLLFLTARFQSEDWIAPELDWKQLFSMKDWLAMLLGAGLIILVCQIFNRAVAGLAPALALPETTSGAKAGRAETAIVAMSEFSETQLEKISRLYRFAELGRLAGGLFHDLATPLTVINISLQEARQKQKGQLNAIREHLNAALKAAEKINQFVIAARSHLRSTHASIIFKPADEIRNLAKLFAHKELQSGVSLQLKLRRKIRLQGDPVKFFQIASNLICNAFEAYPQPSPVGATVLVRLYKQGDRVVFEVSDKGEGIDPKNMTKIFEPFFTTKDGTTGHALSLGLGLATTKNIIEKYFKGKIMIKSRLEHGTCFSIYLPFPGSKTT
jgi:signal transduction histidine kinase